MRFTDVWKNYTPNFVAGLMTAILISIIVGVKPSDIGWIPLTFWIIGLYLLGVIFTWIILLKFK